MTQAEYEATLQERDIKVKMRGKIIHAKIQQYIYPQRTGEIQKKIEEYLTKGDLSTYQFRWVDENIVSILKSSGVNIFDKVSNEEMDQILSEITVGDDLLGLAGTIDLLVKHADGLYSIIDYKTGFNFSKPSMQLMKYFKGYTRDLTTSARDSAGLQVAWYAFLAKLSNPDIKFRDLRIR